MKRLLIIITFVVLLTLYGIITVIYNPWEEPQSGKLNGTNVKDLVQHSDAYEGLNVSLIADIKNKTKISPNILLDLTDGKYSFKGNISEGFNLPIGATIAIQGISLLQTQGFVQITKTHQIHQEYAIGFSLIGLGILGVLFFTYYQFNLKKGFCWRK
ncbi:MAG: hypothetical protein ACFFDT_01830 [Candidatus Hodarchaeota archaeon]